MQADSTRCLRPGTAASWRGGKRCYGRETSLALPPSLTCRTSWLDLQRSADEANNEGAILPGKHPVRHLSALKIPQSLFGPARVALTSFCLLLVAFPAQPWSQQSPQPSGAYAGVAETMEASLDVAPQVTGTISGVVLDRSGAVVTGAQVKLTRENQSSERDEVSDGEGRFSFTNAPAGQFQLTIASDGFATQTYSGTLNSGETYTVPPIVLLVAAARTEVHISLSPVEEAEAEIKDQEKQRVLGIFPNFYVTYNPAAVPLKPKQKFELAWKTTIDPVSIAIAAGSAGIEQAANTFDGYGQGAAGYARRFGAAYGDLVTSTFIGGAVLPSLFKQDPRYFYKGTGSTRSRIFYALANSVICKGDNRRWQPNYSAMVGGLASSAISNLYYPAADRQGVRLTFDNTLIGIASTAITNILQEFLVRKLTPRAPTYAPAAPLQTATP